MCWQQRDTLLPPCQPRTRTACCLPSGYGDLARSRSKPHLGPAARSHSAVRTCDGSPVAPARPADRELVQPADQCQERSQLQQQWPRHPDPHPQRRGTFITGQRKPGLRLARGTVKKQRVPSTGCGDASSQTRIESSKLCSHGY